MRMRLILILILFFLITGTGYSQVAVIANSSVPVESVNSSYLTDLYTQDIQVWKNGDPVVVFDLKPRNDTKNTFYSYIGKSITRMKSIWMKKKLSGEGKPPESLETEEEVLRKVETTPGSIGYLRSDLVSEKVKVLVIIETATENPVINQNKTNSNPKISKP